jgi:hypothetical protein
LALAVFVALLAAPAWVTTVVIGLSVASMAFRAARWVARSSAARGQARAADASSIALGVDEHGRKVRITDRELSAHGLVLGATGSGKTTTLLTILTQQIRQGRSVVAIDMKGSPAFTRQLADAAAAAGRPFKLWTIDGPSFWNPLQHGNPTELKDRLIATERFTEPHYKQAAARYLQTALKVFAAAHPERSPTLDEVVRLMDPRRLPAALRGLPPGFRQDVQGYLSELTPDQHSAIRGLQSRLAIITESHTGRFLAPPPVGDSADAGGAASNATDAGAGAGEAAGSAVGGREGDGAADVGAGAGAAGAGELIDVRRALESNEVVVFSLNSSLYEELSVQVGTMLVRDLISATGSRIKQLENGEQLSQATIAIDEYSSIGNDHVTALFARSREAGQGMLVATQEMADLDRAGRGVLNQVLGNTGFKLTLRQDVPESADKVAQMAGTEKYWEETRQIGGSIFSGYPPRGTRREAERFVIHPNTIKTLPPGEAVLISKLRGGKARKIKVSPPERRDTGPDRREKGPER